MTLVKAMNLGRIVLAGGVAVSAALMFAPLAGADPDPHIPNGAAGWCPGGQQNQGRQYCLGAPFPDGTFLVQGFGIVASQPFRGPQWDASSWCASMVNGRIQGMPAGCGQG